MKFIAHFLPKHFYPVPEGTILRYMGHNFNIDTQEYDVYMEVIGTPPKGQQQPESYQFQTDGTYVTYKLGKLN